MSADEFARCWSLVQLAPGINLVQLGRGQRDGAVFEPARQRVTIIALAAVAGAWLG